MFTCGTKRWPDALPPTFALPQISFPIDEKISNFIQTAR